MTSRPATGADDIVASPDDRGELARVRRRAVRLARRARRAVGAVARTLFRSDLSYTVDVPTPHGRRRRAMLLRLGESFTDGRRAAGGWAFRDVQLDPPGFVFDHADGRSVTVQLHAPSEPQAFARTKTFAVSYRGPRELGSDEAFVRAVVADIERAEAALRGTEGFPGHVLDRSASEVTVYPNDMRVELRPTLACNHKCAFCNSVDRTIENVTRGIDDLRDGIEAWADMPVYRTTVSGGEPTLLRGLPDLLETLADRGLLVELQTNGMALADPAYARRLADAGVHTVLISLHASDAGLSDRHITLYDGAWERTVAGIDNALACGLTVEISHVVHRTNHEETPRFMEFVHARWGRRVRVRLAFVAPTGGAADATEQLIPPLHEALPSLRAALAYARTHRLRVGMVGYCGLPPCLLQPYESFSEITRRSATDYPENHVKFDACHSCVYDRSCPGIWQGYHETYGDPGIAGIATGPWLPRPVRWLLYELTS